MFRGNRCHSRSFPPTCPQTFHPKFQKETWSQHARQCTMFFYVIFQNQYTNSFPQKIEREPEQSTALKRKNKHMFFQPIVVGWVTHEQGLFFYHRKSCCSHLSGYQMYPMPFFSANGWLTTKDRSEIGSSFAKFLVSKVEVL